MRCFWDERQRAHLPTAEFFNGKLHPAAEHQGRVEAILAAIGPTEASADHGIEPILRVHCGDYVEFLRSAFGSWRAAGRDGDAFPYTFPVVGRRPLGLNRIDALLGRFSFDTATPIGERTWDAAYWSVQTALAALDAVLGGEPAAFAFTRPPGHHAGADALPELRKPRYSGEGLAADRGFLGHPPPPRLSLLQFPLHHFRARAAARTDCYQA